MIQKFLLRTGFFLGILTGIIVVCLLAGTILSKQRAHFKVTAPHKKILAIGNSHVTYALNEKILDNLLNFGSDGEAYFYSYTKAKKLLEANPEIRYLLIGFSNNMIRNSIQRWYEDETFISHHLPKYVNWMDVEDLKLIYSENPKAVIMATAKFIAFDLKAVSTGKFPINEWGGPGILTNQLSDSVVKNTNNAMNLYETGIHSVNLRYLKKIIEMAKSKNVQPVLVRTPVHALYKVDNEQDLQHVYRNNFADLPFLDFQHFPLADSCFADYDHLNKNGAELFSRALKAELKKIVD